MSLPGTLETIRFPVDGMTCGTCVARITKAVKGVEGVDRVRVDLGAETVAVRRDRELATDEALAGAIAAAGYDADLSGARIVEADTRRGILDRWLNR